MAKISYFSRNKLTCPSCASNFQKEGLLTGGGRLNAGPLTDELHRLYIPKEQYGPVYPLIYSLDTCPFCYLSLFSSDFNSLKGKYAQQMNSSTERSLRKENIKLLLGQIPDLTVSRDLTGGIAAHVAAMMCYEILPKDYLPTLRQGMLSLRCAWLLAHLDNHQPGNNYGYAAKIMYRKAAFLYMRAIELSDEGEQPLVTDLAGGYGPDTDNNFGIDGCIYLAAQLQYKYGQSTMISKRLKTIEQAKFHISLLVGSGKASQSKTSALINNSRDLFQKLKKEFKKLSD